MSERGEYIDRNYSSNRLDINEMWEDLNRKMKSIIEKYSWSYYKISKYGDPL